MDERVAALLVAAGGDELGVELLRDHNAAAARRLTQLLGVAARQTATSTVNRFVVRSGKPSGVHAAAGRGGRENLRWAPTAGLWHWSSSRGAAKPMAVLSPDPQIADC
jgi:hypothetical protein